MGNTFRIILENFPHKPGLYNESFRRYRLNDGERDIKDGERGIKNNTITKQRKPPEKQIYRWIFIFEIYAKALLLLQVK